VNEASIFADLGGELDRIALGVPVGIGREAEEHVANLVSG
jgi:hypothetical protein